mgnify:CR=1 FL=1|tara:strand:- start:2871 stop:4106 length:1236 start_codon:yes stop_codon:yes gene_type:complete
MASYIFIVNEKTFPIHLKYMFAGTGKEDGTENIGMIEDISGCREGDKVIFYLTQHDYEEGKFFGSFKIKSKNAFWDKEGISQELGGKKALTNRILIDVDEVYQKGITEWNCLDNLDNLPGGRNGKAKDLIWSLIYRKLSAGRGCTPIFDYEFSRIMDLIKKVKDNIKLKKAINYDFKDEKIIPLDNEEIKYDCSTITENMIPLLDPKGNTYSPEEKIVKLKGGDIIFSKKTKKGKIREQWKCESELECFFNQNACLNDKRVDEILGKKEELDFFGSQIISGMGERKIDILTIGKDKLIKLIELKDEGGYFENDFLETHLDQIRNYIKWCIQYIKEPEEKEIQPILVINKRVLSKKQEKDKKILKLLTEQDLKNIIKFNKEKVDDAKIRPFKIYFWSIEENKIKFEKFDYND